MSKLVSIVIATYNRPDFIVKSLNNVFRQTYRPLEVIVVDDGSTAETGQAVRDWRARHEGSPGFTLRWRWQSNRGPAAARNAGIRLFQGDYLLFLDDDDLMADSSLACLADRLRHKNTLQDAAIAMASYRNWADGAAVGPTRAPVDFCQQEIIESMIAGSWFVPVHGYLFTRAAITRIGQWNPLLTSQEDDEYLLRAATQKISFHPAPQALVYYCQHDGVRRSVPGHQGRAVHSGMQKRMHADLVIRETMFEQLREQQRLDAFADGFQAWHRRFRHRYASCFSDEIRTNDFLVWVRRNGSSEQPSQRVTDPV